MSRSVLVEGSVATDVLPYATVAEAWREYARQNPCWAAARWRAESFRATAGEPMTVRRAEALNAVLAACPTHVVPGELLIGIGNLGRLLPAGVLTEAEIRADREFLATIGARHFGTHADHHAPDYPKLLRLGFGGLRDEVLAARPRQDAKGQVFLDSMLVALQGASDHLKRWSRHLADLAATGSPYAAQLREQAEMLDRLATAPPATFHEALQLVLLYHYMMQLDDRYAMAFGRLDQALYPFYRADRDAGRLTDGHAQALLDHLFAKITVDGDVQNIALGGVRPEDGSDATNELSGMILEACKRVGRPGGNCTARIHRHTPPAFLEKCAEVIRTGIGYPAVFNDDVEIPALVSLGYRLEDARDYCFVGCIEVFIPGRQGPWADGRSNPLYCLNLALFDGEDSLSGQRVAPATGQAPADFEAFYQAFLGHCRTHVDQLIEQCNAMQRAAQERAEGLTSPLMSALTADCIERGRDLNDGGAVYPANNGFAGMGVGSVADTLAAVRQFVFEEKRFTLERLREMLRADFVGSESERQLLLHGAPKYGNDDDRVDSLAARFVRDYAALFRAHRNPHGGFYWLLLGANIQNIAGGAAVGATADGRLARQPLSDAASPTFGRDRRGPAAVVRSVAKLPYRLCVGGNVINMKLHPSSLAGTRGLRALASLIRTCFDLGGVQLQFNTTDRETLRQAMAAPAEHAGLVVRVSGFSAHFTHLDRAVQEDILARTEHELN